MSQPLVYKTCTVTATNAATSLLSLLVAIDSGIPGYCRELFLQGDPGNSTNNILVGDDQLATTRMGYSLVAGGSRNYRDSTVAGLPISNMFILASAGSPKLNVEILM